ncbi:ATP-binding protein [Hamadaea sp. NPDC051192]|uniref:ATP-binding protein n=1 Tax=Hamadaea sp. NPDC051192 TaxID=3154940 RepID=UPI00342786A8
MTIPTLTVLVGAPASGKSHWCAAAGLPATSVVCLDTVRGWVSDDINDQDATAAAVPVMLGLVEARLSYGRDTVVDATSASVNDRADLIRLARAVDVPARVVLFDVDLDLAMARNAERPGPPPGRRYGRRVPDPVLQHVHAAIRDLTAHPAQLIAEGFTAVHSPTGALLAGQPAT